MVSRKTSAMTRTRHISATVTGVASKHAFATFIWTRSAGTRRAWNGGTSPGNSFTAHITSTKSTRIATGRTGQSGSGPGHSANARCTRPIPARFPIGPSDLRREFLRTALLTHAGRKSLIPPYPNKAPTVPKPSKASRTASWVFINLPASQTQSPVLLNRCRG